MQNVFSTINIIVIIVHSIILILFLILFILHFVLLSLLLQIDQEYCTFYRRLSHHIFIHKGLNSKMTFLKNR